MYYRRKVREHHRRRRRLSKRYQTHIRTTLLALHTQTKIKNDKMKRNKRCCLLLLFYQLHQVPMLVIFDKHCQTQIEPFCSKYEQTLINNCFVLQFVSDVDERRVAQTAKSNHAATQAHYRYRRSDNMILLISIMIICFFSRVVYERKTNQHVTLRFSASTMVL